ncbi:MAG TPA: hypothetical protein VLW52_09445 [Opitutaceae bacterium]|nr:hypothetical protein [Opitutaceae bacterium]
MNIKATEKWHEGSNLPCEAVRAGSRLQRIVDGIAPNPFGGIRPCLFLALPSFRIAFKIRRQHWIYSICRRRLIEEGNRSPISAGNIVAHGTERQRLSAKGGLARGSWLNDLNIALRISHRINDYRLVAG